MDILRMGKDMISKADDHAIYYDCKVNWFKDITEAVDYFKERHGVEPKRVYVMSTGWLVGPVPEEQEG